MVQISPPPPPAIGPSTNWLYLFRVILLLLCSILNAATFGIIVYDFIVYYGGAAIVINIIGISSGVLTLVLIPVMLLVGRRRENRLLVYILTEIVVFGLLGTLWTVTAGFTIEDEVDICPSRFFRSEGFCKHLSAKKGLSVAIFVLLLFYALTLVIYAVVHIDTAGSSVWFQTVREQGLRHPAGTASAAPATGTMALGLTSMWDEKTTDEVRSEVATSPTSGAVPGHTFQAPSGAPSFGVTTYPPLTLSQAVAMQMAAANTGPALDASVSNTTNLPSGVGVGSALTAQQYHSPATQRVNMRVISRSSPQRQDVGLQNTIGYQGAPVTPPYPQV